MSNKLPSVKERAMQYAKSQGITMRKFCESINMNYSSFTGDAKKRPINSDAISKLVSKYKDLNPYWLLTGNGEMIISTSNNLTIHEFENNNVPKGAVPFYNLAVSAGKSLIAGTGSINPDGYIKDLPGIGSTEAFLPVFGTSMYPAIKEGAIIGVQKVEHWEHLNTQHKYLIITHDDRMVKYIKYDKDDDSILWCMSPNYSDFSIVKDEIIEIHRVTLVINTEY